MVSSFEAYNLLDTTRPWCWICGRGEREPYPWWSGPWMLQCAHLAAGSGRMIRRVDRRAVILACPVCHTLHRHNAGYAVLNGHKFPCVTDGNVLWAKMFRDNEYFDEEQILTWWLGIPPTPMEPPRLFMDSYTERHGIENEPSRYDGYVKYLRKKQAEAGDAPFRFSQRICARDLGPAAIDYINKLRRLGVIQHNGAGWYRFNEPDISELKQ